MANGITPQRVPWKNAGNVSQKVFPWALWQTLTVYYKCRIPKEYQNLSSTDKNTTRSSR